MHIRLGVSILKRFCQKNTRERKDPTWDDEKPKALPQIDTREPHFLQEEDDDLDSLVYRKYWEESFWPRRFRSSIQDNDWNLHHNRVDYYHAQNPTPCSVAKWKEIEPGVEH